MLVDLADVGGNVRDGIHIASAGGTWMGCVYGIAGLRDRHGILHFQPRLPGDWKRLCFRLTVRGRTLEVDIRLTTATYTLIDGEPLTIHHIGEPLDLHASEPVERPLGIASG